MLPTMDGTPHIYIAVIDDDESMCLAMSRLLRAAHLQPVTYPTAEAFLTDLKRPKFDCLLLDSHLSGISGLELSRRLLAVKDTTPVIFITEHDSPGPQAPAEAVACAGYFRKTTSGADILAAINRVLGRNEKSYQSAHRMSL